MKRVAWAVASLPVLGIVLYLLLAPKGHEKKSSAEPEHRHEHSQGSNSVRNEGAKQSEASKQLALHEVYLESVKRADKSRLQSDESLRQSASHMTPEFLARLVDDKVRAREPEYRALFDTWKLRPATSDVVLKIIRERELRLKEHMAEHWKNASGTANSYGENKAVEAAVAEAQLRKLIGNARFTELSSKEKHLDNAELQKALAKDRGEKE